MKKDIGIAIAAAIGVFVLLFVIMAFAGLLTFGESVVKSKVDQAANQYREKSILFDPNNSIGQYETFYDDCRSVVALSEKISAAKEQLSFSVKTYDKENDTFGEQAKSINALRENVRGLTNQQIDIAQDYNANSSKTTKAQFKAADLPYTLDAPYEEIECGNAKEAGR